MHWHWSEILSGATAWALIGHMVSTVPPSKNEWIRWLIGGVQFAVGQRNAGLNTMKGQDSTIVATPIADRGLSVTAEIKPPDVISQSDKP